jgi:beta-ribofuranosylaminobenzene 5'-phosphate synthase
MPSDPAFSSPAAVEIRTPARLHIGMLSFGVPGVRSFGGVGVMTDRPAVHLRLRKANRLEARGPHAERAVKFARACMQAWGLGDVGCSLEVVTAPAAHVGLGSGTQLGLAVAAGMRQLFRRPEGEPDEPAVTHPLQAPLEPGEHDWVFDVQEAIELARVVGRGRRSSVGVYGFSRGGLIVEAGRLVAGDGSDDDDDARREFSPMIARVRLPAAWRCVVIAARDAVGLSGPAEREAFGRLPPVAAEVTAELSRIALLELLPAAVEGKFTEFAAAVRRYGELAGQPFAAESQQLPHAPATAKLLELLGELGIVGAAQSSWGPTVMACCPSLEAAGDLAEALDRLGLARHHDVVIARFDSQGAVLREVE